MTSGIVGDKVAGAAVGMKFELIATNLAKEKDKLRLAFAEEKADPAR